MPVQKLPGRLDGDDGGGKSIVSRIFPEECGEGFPDAQGEFGEKTSPTPERRAQDLGECEDEMSVRCGADHMLPDKLGPQGGALGGTGRTNTSFLIGEGDEILVSACVAPDSRESALGKAAVQKSLDGLRDDPTHRTEGLLEPVFVFPGEVVEIMMKDSVEEGPLGMPEAVDFRLTESR
jgi:hypothetical protein